VELNDVLTGSRHVSTGFHLEAGRAWRRMGAPTLAHSPLIYGALEFRCAIERFVLELHILVAPKPLDPNQIPRDFADLVALVHTNTGRKRLLWRTLTFNAVYARTVMGLPFDMAIPDVGVLHRWWQDLSEYCHRQVSPEQTWGYPDWIRKGYELLETVEGRLSEMTDSQQRGWLRPETMPDEFQEERARFLASDDGPDTLERRLALMKPVVAARLAIARKDA
jgi:hypothetical protein